MQVEIGALPDDPLAAAAQFHAEVLPRVLALLAGAPDHLTLLFAPADPAQVDWRRAAVATLAREKAPVRINGIAGDEGPAMDMTADYIATAPGLTGQYLVLDTNGAV